MQKVNRWIMANAMVLGLGGTAIAAKSSGTAAAGSSSQSLTEQTLGKKVTEIFKSVSGKICNKDTVAQFIESLGTKKDVAETERVGFFSKAGFAVKSCAAHLVQGMTQNLLCSAFDLMKAVTNIASEAGKFVSALWKNRKACIEESTDAIPVTKYPGLFVCGAVQYVKEKVKNVSTCFKDLKKNKAWKTLLAEAGKSACDVVGSLASAVIIAPAIATVKLPSLFQWASATLAKIAKTASSTKMADILKHAGAQTTDQAVQYLQATLQTASSCAAFLPKDKAAVPATTASTTTAVTTPTAATGTSTTP